jgi:hypothetical protein
VAVVRHSFPQEPQTLPFKTLAWKVAPSTAYEQTAVNVVFFLSGQMNLGGGNDSECSDSVDNDQDGQTGFLADVGCSSASDNRETA